MTERSTDEPSAVEDTNPPTPTPGQLVRDDLNAIAAAHGTWNTADARSTEACHLALGEVFVRSAPTDDDPARLTALRAEVLLHPEVLQSRTYSVLKEFAAELHLTLLFGLKARRGVKSNWKNTIKSAEKCFAEGTIADRTVEAFVEWIEPLGMKGARKLLSGSRKDRDEKAILDFGDHRGEPFTVPLPLDKAELPHGYFLILGRCFEAGDDAEAIILLTDKRLVASVCTAAKKLEEEAEAENRKTYQEEMENSDTPERPANLLIPKHLREHFDGRFHYKDEDERNEFLLERAKEKEEAQKKRGEFKNPRSQTEIARRYGDKPRLPEEVFRDAPVEDGQTDDGPPGADASVTDASTDEHNPPSPSATEDVDYFADLDTE